MKKINGVFAGNKNHTGFSYSETITVYDNPIVLIAKVSPVSQYYNQGKKYYVTVSYGGILLKNQNVVFTINGKSYTRTTDANGPAYITIESFVPNTYTATVKVSYNGKTVTNSSKVAISKATVKLSIKSKKIRKGKYLYVRTLNINKKAVKGLKANDSIKAYIAANIEFDKSLEILLKDLEESGQLENTVIVISPDHYPYGLTNDDIKSYVDWVENDTFDIYRNNLIIYNSELTGIEVDKNVGSIDILPTLLNMFGIEYDSRLLMGHDIFSDASDLVIYNNKSWITERGRYDYIKKKFYPNEGYTDDKDYIKKINNIVSTKFQVSKTILQKNYYKKVIGE